METDTQSDFDRAAEKRDDLDYLEAQLSRPDTWLLPLWQGKVFTLEGEAAHEGVPLLVRRDQGDTLLDQSGEVVWLGLYRDRPCFGLDISPLSTPEKHAALSGSAAVELRALLPRLSSGYAELCMSARALVLWHERHRYCSVCGHPSNPRRGGHLRVCTNPDCRSEHFPRTDPCVLVLICDGERCLLGRSKGWPEGMYSALAGFVEPAETLEQAVAREVLEEVGVHVGSMRYAGSQPWPFPASLMVGFVATARTLEIEVDTHELEAARWVTRAELQAPRSHGFFVPPPFAIAGRLIAAFAEGSLVPPDASLA
jgi:NAD+ diphosphatase